MSPDPRASVPATRNLQLLGTIPQHLRKSVDLRIFNGTAARLLLTTIF